MWQHIVDAPGVRGKRWRAAGIRIQKSRIEHQLHRTVRPPPRSCRLHEQRAGSAAPHFEQCARLSLARRAAVNRVVQMGIENGVGHFRRVDLNLDRAARNPPRIVEVMHGAAAPAAG